MKNVTNYMPLNAYCPCNMTVRGHCALKICQMLYFFAFCQAEGNCNVICVMIGSAVAGMGSSYPLPWARVTLWWMWC